MTYQLPLSERIRIQFEILCENCTDCFGSLSSSYKRPMFFLASCALFLTVRSARKSISKAKMGGVMGGYGTGGYGTSSSGYSSRLYGGSSASLTGGSGLYGSSSTYGGLGTGVSSGGGLMGSSNSYGIRGASPSMGGSSYSGYGQASMGGSSFGSSMGGGGKGTAQLVDSNPTSVVALDPSIRFYNYGGVIEFYGQIEVVQAFDAPLYVSQIVSEPGQSKVLLVDGGGSLNSALFDSEMANTAMRNGWKGIIVYGAVRNALQLSKLTFGVKALGTNPIKGRGSNGQRGAGITIGTSQVQSGLWVYADSDGIVLSQSDISGGSFGGGNAIMSGGSSMSGGGGTFGSYGGASSMSNGAYGGSLSSYGTGSMGGLSGSSSYGGSSLTGGYGSSNSMLTGGYGSNSNGGSMYGTSPGSSFSNSGGYGSSSIYGGYGSSSPYSYGKSSMQSSKKRKHKMFKILLATSIAAIVWIACLR